MQLYQPHWTGYVQQFKLIYLSSTCNTNHTGSCTTVYTQCIYPVHAIIPTTLDHVRQFTLIYLSSTCHYTNHTGSCTTVYTQYSYPVHVIIPTTLDHVQQFTFNTFIQYMSLYQPHWIMNNSLHSIHLSSTCHYTNHTGSCTTVYTQYMYPVNVIIPTTLDHVQQFTLNTVIELVLSTLEQKTFIINNIVFL